MNQCGLQYTSAWNNGGNLSVQLSLSLSQTSKGAMSFLLSPMFSLQQNQETRGWNMFCQEAGRGEWEGSTNNVYTCK
jgi:hypothetical protein